VVRRRAAAGCLLLTLGAAACASPEPIARLSFVTTKPGVVQPEILAEDVEGETCFTRDLVRVLLTPPWRAPRADHAPAVARALDDVPEADLLTDVRVQVRVTNWLLFQRICAIATGDAGRLP